MKITAYSLKKTEQLLVEISEKPVEKLEVICSLITFFITMEFNMVGSNLSSLIYIFLCHLNELWACLCYLKNTINDTVKTCNLRNKKVNGG